MKVKIVQAGTDDVGVTVETPALVFLTSEGDELSVWHADSDAFNPDDIPTMRDYTLFEAFIVLSCRKLGWKFTDEKGDEE